MCIRDRVKGYVANHNNTFKTADLKRLMDEVVAKGWRLEKMQDYKKEYPWDFTIECIVIRVMDESSEDSESSSDWRNLKIIVISKFI